MHREPGHPGDEAAQVQRSDARDGPEAGDGGHRALVAVPERGAGLTPLDPGGDLAGRVLGPLDRDGGYPGQAIQRHHVPDHEDLRVTGKRQVGLDQHPATAVDLGVGLLGELPAER